ncbi:MAG TPA: substrate-binding domain-containing protein, partial [Beijerinckiaceae bacterium]
GRTLLAQIEDIEQGIARYKGCDIPELRLGLIESVASALVPHLVRRLSGTVGALSVTSGTTHPLAPELRAGELDMMISSEQIEDEAIVTEPLLAEPVILVLPKGRAAPRDWDEISALARELDFIHYGSRRRVGRLVRRQFERFGVETHGHIEFDSSVALFDVVRNGAGWAATTPLCMLCAGVDADDVEIATFPDVTPMRSINAIWVRERADTGVEMVARLCRSIFGEITPQLTQRAGAAADRVHVLPTEA